MMKKINVMLPLAYSNFYLALPPESRESPTVTFNLVIHWPEGIIIIITTRPKPAYGRQGLAGSWGQDTDEVSTMETTLKNHGNQPPLVQKT